MRKDQASILCFPIIYVLGIGYSEDKTEVRCLLRNGPQVIAAVFYKGGRELCEIDWALALCRLKRTENG